MSPKRKKAQPRSSKKDDALFKQPTAVPNARPRRSRSRTRKNRKSYRESPESGGDARDSPSPSRSPQINRGRPARKSLNLQNPGDNDSLFNMIKAETALNTIITDWIKKYNQNREEAVAVLLEFFVNSSGNESKITPEILRSIEMRELIDKIIADSNDNSKNCPLIGTNARRGEFLHNFIDFISMIFQRCQNSIIHDDYFLKTLENFVMNLSESKLRVLRHTATLTALKIVTALIEVILTLATEIREIKCQLQSLDPENKFRGRKAAAPDNIRALWLNYVERKGKMDKIHTAMNNLMKSVFDYRYRDTLPDIRLMCIQEYGVWVEKLPIVFCTDKFLDVPGFSLSDKLPDMRLSSLKILQSLYALVPLTPPLENFIDKFKQRLLAMPLDKDIKVALECIKLLLIIRRIHPEILKVHDECDNVYYLLFAEDRSLAVTSGEFLMETLTLEDEEPVDRPQRGMNRLSNTRKIRNLVSFFMDSELLDHADYLVDALIDNEMMQDWQCMTDLLLEQPGPEPGLIEPQEEALIKIMMSCIKQAATGQPPVGRKKKALSERDKKRIATSTRKLSIHFMRTLPRLLQKYRDKPVLLAELLTIPQSFALKLFVQDHENFQFLLDKITEIVDDADDERVIQSSSYTLKYFCNEFYPGRAQCIAARDEIIASLDRRYRTAVDDYVTLTTSGETTDREALDKIMIFLKKIAIFYANHNLNVCNLWNSLWEIIESSRDPSTNLTSEAVAHALQACYFALIWGKQELGDAGEGGEVAAGNLKERLDNFMNILKDFLSAEGNNDLHVVREKAYTIITDLLIIFNKSLRIEAEPLLHQIVHEPAPDLCDVLSAFVQDHVFIEENTTTEENMTTEENTENHAKRRSFLMAFCRLIMYNVLPIKSADDIFKNYVRYYNDYGDIIKMTLTRAREINRDTWALTLQLSLSKLFDEVFEEKGADMEDADMKSVKELARSFGSFFGSGAEKRDEIFMIHLGGINFIATGSKDSTGIPAKLRYFNVLVEFSSKLVAGDRNKILEFLERTFPVHSSCGDEWEPLVKYRKSLGFVEENENQDTGPRRSTRRSRNQPTVPEESEAEWTDVGSDNDSISDQSKQKKKATRGKKTKKTLKRTPVNATKPRKPPKASTPTETTSVRRSYHNVPSAVQTELDAMNINLSNERTISQESDSDVNMEVDTE